MQPAPRMTSAPTPKRPRYPSVVVIGACCAYAAIEIDHASSQKKLNGEDGGGDDGQASASMRKEEKREEGQG